MLPAVGYTNADQSHFTSRHYWEVGDTDPRLQTGWLGRYLDHVGTADNPLQGVSLDGDLSPRSRPAKKPVAALSGAGDYSFWAPGVWGQVEERMLDGSRRRSAAPVGTTRRSRARGRSPFSRTACASSSRPSTPQRLHSPVPYPKSDSGFPDQLAGLAAMLAAGLPLHCVALSAYGMYDTHSEQADTLAEGLS